ncbi:MAG: DUF2007 domain-containing protein [Pseudomonadota bacterium]
MQRLYSAANLPEAYLVRGLLAAAGIEARVFNEYAGGALGELPFAEAAPSVWVEEERDLPRARQVVATYENAAAAPGVTRCGACGEENPHDFAVCWQCQRAL